MQKNEVGPLMPYTKKLKWISNLSGRAKLKLLEENIGLDLCDCGFGNGFLDMTLKAQTTKEKIHELDSIKIKNSCESKDTVKKVKRQFMEWEKIFANHVTDKCLVSGICKELLELHNQKTTQFLNGQRT